MRDFFAWVDGGAVPTLAITGEIAPDGWGFPEDTTPARFSEQLAAHEGEDILVSIDSGGGDVFAGFDIYNALKMRTGKTTVRIVGLAASAASYIAMAASPGELEMCRASMMMIHKPWGGTVGDAEKHRRDAELLDLIEEIMRGIYMERFTGTEEELSALLAEETWYSATQALGKGLCDRIADAAEVETAASAAARQMERFAAMSVEQVRRQWGHLIPAKKPQAAPVPEDRTDYLALADAAIGGML